MTKWVTIIVDKCIDVFHDASGTSNTRGKVGTRRNLLSLQMFFFFVNTALSIWPLICYWNFSHNIHIVFWMGMTPARANLLVPLTLYGCAFSLIFFYSIDLRPKTIKRGIFTVFFLCGAVLMSAGAYVSWEAEYVSAQLHASCGEDPLTAKMQREWQKLATFYDECAQKLGERPSFIQQCPRFSESLESTAEDITYVNYIEDMELDFDCQGFCKFYPIPFFNEDADAGNRCSNLISHTVHRIGHASGVPTMIIGLVMAVIGGLFYGYDHI